MATDKKSSGLMFSLRPFISDSHKNTRSVKDEGVVLEDIKTDVLLPGFTDDDLLSYVSLNQAFISSNLKGWGLTVDEFGGESDAYIVSDILVYYFST